LVNTFLPYEDFYESAKALDYRRLGKQRVEALQILRANLGLTAGWVNHPASKMWKGHEACLAVYGLAMCKEWVGRGFKDSCTDKFKDLFKQCKQGIISDPYWLGDSDLHLSHQSNLLRKDPVYYGRYGWEVSDDLPYVWPGSVNLVNSTV